VAVVFQFDLNGLDHSVRQEIEFVVAGYQRGHQNDDIAERTNPNAVINRTLTNFSADLCGGIKTFFLLTVDDQLDANHQATATDITDFGMIPELIQPAAQAIGFPVDRADKFFSLKKLDGRDRSGSRQWIAGVGVAMEELM
jgi:hypothetical protein